MTVTGNDYAKHDRVPTSPSEHGGFATGILLGLSVGLIAGHFWLWSRRDDDVAADFNPQLFDAESFVIASTPDQEEDTMASLTSLNRTSEFAPLEFDKQTDVGRVVLSDQDRDDDELHFFPEATSVPDQLAFYEAPLPVTAKSTTESPQPAPAEPRSLESLSSDAPQPDALQPAPSASPIDARTEKREALARTIIADELPDATQEEQEVWYDVLQGLPPDDIKGILRMKKNLGEANILPTPRPTKLDVLATVTLPAPSTPSIDVKHDSTDSFQDALRRLIRIEQLNLAHADKIAHKRLVCSLRESGTDDDRLPTLTVGSPHRDMRHGKLISTDGQLDVGIRGDGFLQVRNGDDIRFTRDGRLAINEQRHLVLRNRDITWRLHPPVVVPEEISRLVIQPNGRLSSIDTEEPFATIAVFRFLSSDGLRYVGDGLFAATDVSGTSAATFDEENALHQFQLEASNVDCDTCWDRIKRYRNLLDEYDR